MRQAKRLSNGVVVIAECEAAGRLVRETYISDEEGLTKMVEGQLARGGASSETRRDQTE